jgi:hypothetical protein
VLQNKADYLSENKAYETVSPIKMGPAKQCFPPNAGSKMMIAAFVVHA